MNQRAAGIFENELAQCVKKRFEQLLKENHSVYIAADRILEEHAGKVHDPDDGPAIFFALAALQHEHGVVTPKIRKRVLTMINSGEALERWKGSENYAARAKVEQTLRTKLVELG